MLCGNNLGLVHGGLADLAGGNVDDAPQAQIVRGVVDDAQIGKHILDLGPVKKLQTTVDLIGDAAALQAYSSALDWAFIRYSTAQSPQLPPRR